MAETKVKLVKGGSTPVNVYSGSFGTVERVERSYIVTLPDGTMIGTVRQAWAVDYPGARSKVVSYWQTYDQQGQPFDGSFGYHDYRKDAVAAVVRHFEGRPR